MNLTGQFDNEFHHVVIKTIWMTVAEGAVAGQCDESLHVLLYELNQRLLAST